MKYNEAIDYLFNRLPAYESHGVSGYKPGLGRTQALANYFGNPEKRLKAIHVAGTNGKGSVCNLLAAILQTEGYKVGLYTSPHLVDFRERIRINGKCIDENEVVNFVAKVQKSVFADFSTFFEITTIMAFDYFARQKVDFAIVEVGLGGRLDSTNIITPILSVITNISLDHTSLLGNNEVLIAREKAGIIKNGVPVVIGEADKTDVEKVFAEVAALSHSPIYKPDIISKHYLKNDGLHLLDQDFGELICPLTGDYQIKNIATTLSAIKVLRTKGVTINNCSITNGIRDVQELTGFYSRWTILAHEPLIICDPGHNIAGWTYITTQLHNIKHRKLHMVIGFVADKDVDALLQLMPKQASYYFTQSTTKRSLPSNTLKDLATHYGLIGKSFADCKNAVTAAKNAAATDDVIFIGGSFYLLGELFAQRAI